MSEKSKIDASVVREAAKGRWLEIFNQLAPGQLDIAMARPGKHCPCPVCGGTDRFRLYRDVRETGGAYCNSCVNPRTGKHGFGDGFDLLAHMLGLQRTEFPTLLEAIAAVVGVTGCEVVVPRRKGERPPERKKLDVDGDVELRQKLTTMWSEAVSLSHDKAYVARRYLMSRGLASLPWEDSPFVRLHPNLPYWDEDKTGYVCRGKFPCLLFRVMNAEGQSVTLHRIYLAHDGSGKAPVSNPKKLCPIPSDRTHLGMAIPLGAACGPVLAIAEGPETALAVTVATGISCWAAISATFMPNVFPKKTVKVPVGSKSTIRSLLGRVWNKAVDDTWVEQVQLSIPEGVDAIHIFADVEAAGVGVSAALALKASLLTSGVQAAVWTPELPDDRSSYDWLDVFNLYGRAGFPERLVASRKSAQLAASVAI